MKDWREGRKERERRGEDGEKEGRTGGKEGRKKK